MLTINEKGGSKAYSSCLCENGGYFGIYFLDIFSFLCNTFPFPAHKRQKKTAKGDGHHSMVVVVLIII